VGQGRDQGNGETCSSSAGKKVKELKRFILIDFEGHLLAAIVHGSGIQDRDGLPLNDLTLTFSPLFGLFSWLQKIFADARLLLRRCAAERTLGRRTLRPARATCILGRDLSEA
jgi:hypothetical protein